MPRRQGIFWLCTIPATNSHTLDWPPRELIPGLSWIKGQRELGSTTDYDHWQVCVAFNKKISLSGIQKLLGTDGHYELSRSSAAADYVWKQETSVDGTRFELGVKPIQRNCKIEWESVWNAAKLGKLEDIPANVRVSSYRALRTIASDYSKTQPLDRECYVFWGPTGTGKSHRAWAEAGMDSYSKDPRTKFWDGYNGESNVVLDEFRGSIDISHLLRWLDKYPVRVEIKGSTKPLVATKIWITSNLDPRLWYPELDQDTLEALRRRLKITHFNKSLMSYTLSYFYLREKRKPSKTLPSPQE